MYINCEFYPGSENLELGWLAGQKKSGHGAPMLCDPPSGF